MRKALCAQMIFLCLLLAACGGQRAEGNDAQALALQIRTEYLAMTGCTGALSLCADYGQRVYEYGMDFTWDKETGTAMTLTAPEDISGVIIRMEAGQTALEYDGTRLETGPLSPEGLSPLETMPLLLTYAKEGYIAACTMETLGETETLRMDCRQPEAEAGSGTEASLWFDPESRALLQGEISVDGRSVLTCKVTEFRRI
ncbi:MAG: hypothetical protein RR403_07950 [Pseudoflavonifractor sp.]